MAPVEPARPAAHRHAGVPARFVTVLALIHVFAVSRAAADPLSVDRWTVDGGGASSVGAGSFALGATIGQPDAGIVAAGGIAILGGFWAPGTAPLLAVDPPDSGDPGTAGRDAILELRIHPAAPNPTHDRTSIALDLPATAAVRIEVFDLRGARLALLADGLFPAGRHAFDWRATDAAGRRVGPGLYVMRVRAAQIERIQKIVVLR